MKKALLMNAINPSIGGVLIRGEKGTAKSSAVRALAEILPMLEVVPGCPFSCDPALQQELCDYCQDLSTKGIHPEPLTRQVRVVNLPLGATEDRVVGTIDIERALKEGIKALEPGILAEANRGILYIDEVNLLDDHVVDVLLDAAAMGVNTVEREGISFSHPARFILIGTMNPEEGELRPQLLDRFGLQVTVEALDDPNARISIIDVAEEFLKNPDHFRKKYQKEQNAVTKKIIQAKKFLPKTSISDTYKKKTVDICIELGVKTHRAEITIIRTAKTIAAFEGRKEVNENDLREAIELALPHRMRKRPFEEPKIDKDRLDDLMNDEPDSREKPPESQESGTDTEPFPQETTNQDRDQSNGTEKGGKGGGASQEMVFAIGMPADPARIRDQIPKTMKERYAPGRRMKTDESKHRGQYIGTQKNPKTSDIALDATIRSVAPFQVQRMHEDMAVIIRPDEILEKKRMSKTATAILFVVDASGSMGAMKRMEAAKGAIFSLLEDSYRFRDRVGMITFKGNQADLVLPFTSSIDLAYKRLGEIPTGGKTPLSAALNKAADTIVHEKRKYPGLIPLLILISDGRANVGNGRSIKEEIGFAASDLAELNCKLIVIDTEEIQRKNFGIRLGYCNLIADKSGGTYIRLPDLSSQVISGIIQNDLQVSMQLSATLS